VLVEKLRLLFVEPMERHMEIDAKLIVKKFLSSVIRDVLAKKRNHLAFVEEILLLSVEPMEKRMQIDAQLSVKKFLSSVLRNVLAKKR